MSLLAAEMNHRAQIDWTLNLLLDAVLTMSFRSSALSMQ